MFKIPPLRRRGSYEMDMCNGPLLSKILIFTIPIILSGMLQLLFNAVDMVVVGTYVGSGALAAVGSTGALINLILNLFIGLSVGANVMVARYYGAQDNKMVSKTVHTAILTSIISGIILIFLGISLAKPLLSLMGTPADVLDDAALYMRIFFIGMPFNMFFNFGSAILRAVGDTKRPLYFLIIAGFVNVLLNLFFVLVFKMGVDGVAWATIISQGVSAFLIFLCFIKSQGAYRLDLKSLKIDRKILWNISKIGIPAALQGATFSISNVLIQSSINSFGAVAMAGSTASANIEGFIFSATNSFSQSGLSFAGQNMGAKKYDRIKKVTASCMLLGIAFGLVLGLGSVLFSNNLLGLYTSDADVLRYGFDRLLIMGTTYFLDAIMDIFCGILRGMGYSILPTIATITGVCGLRVVWIYTIFAQNRTLSVLYSVYPITWIVTSIFLFGTFIFAMKSLNKHKLVSENDSEKPAPCV